MSSCRSLPYSFLPAYQRESQVRLIPRRKPGRIDLLTHYAFSLPLFGGGFFRRRLFGGRLAAGFFGRGFGFGLGGVFLGFFFALFLDHDGDLAEEFLDAARIAAGAGMEALHHQILADAGFAHHQIVDIEIVIVLGIGDGGLQNLLHILGDALGREGEIGQRALHPLAADGLGHQVQLAR